MTIGACCCTGLRETNGQFAVCAISGYMIASATAEDDISGLRHRGCLGYIIPGVFERTVARLVIALRGDVVRSMRSDKLRPRELRVGFSGHNRSSSLTLTLHRVLEDNIIDEDTARQTFHAHAH